MDLRIYPAESPSISVIANRLHLSLNVSIASRIDHHWSKILLSDSTVSFSMGSLWDNLESSGGEEVENIMDNYPKCRPRCHKVDLGLNGVKRPGECIVIGN